MASAPTAPAPDAAERFRVYERKRGFSALNLSELWPYRELLYFLTWRDILVRYKQAVLGVLWAILQPVLTMVVFTVVFNKGLNVKSPDPDIPYAIFSYCGLLPWQYFSGALARSSQSLVGNSNLLTKVYFPRLVIPISGVLSGLVDFAHLVRRAALPHGRLRHRADLEHGVSALPAPAGHVHGARRRPVAQRTQRALPGRAVHDPVPRAALDVREPRHLPDQHRSPQDAASPLRPQPDDRRHRRLPLGAARRAAPRHVSLDLGAASCSCCSSAGCTTSSAWSACSRTWSDERRRPPHP